MTKKRKRPQSRHVHFDTTGLCRELHRGGGRLHFDPTDMEIQRTFAAVIIDNYCRRLVEEHNWVIKMDDRAHEILIARVIIAMTNAINESRPSYFNEFIPGDKEQRREWTMKLADTIIDAGETVVMEAINNVADHVVPVTPPSRPQ